MQRIVEVQKLIYDKTTERTCTIGKLIDMNDVISIEQGDEISMGELKVDKLNCVVTMYGEFW